MFKTIEILPGATGPLVAAGIVVVLIGADIAALARWTTELYLQRVGYKAAMPLRSVESTD